MDDFHLRFTASDHWRHMNRPLALAIWSGPPPDLSDVVADWYLLGCLQGSLQYLENGVERTIPAEHAVLGSAQERPCVCLDRDARALLFLFVGATELCKEIQNGLCMPTPLPRQANACQRLLGFERLQRRGDVTLSALDGYTLVGVVLTSLIQYADNEPGNHPHLVQRACQALNRQLERPYDANALAEHLQISVNYLGRVFTQAMGMSPGQYHKQQRLCYAARLLKTTSLGIQEIADRLQYGHASTFARAFRSVYRMSPQEFRDHASAPLM